MSTEDTVGVEVKRESAVAIPEGMRRLRNRVRRISVVRLLFFVFISYLFYVLPYTMLTMDLLSFVNNRI